MPFQPTSPATGQITTSEDKLMGVMQIHELNIRIDPNDEAGVRVNVKWSEGYTQDNVYHAMRHHQAEMIGSNVVTKINEATQGDSVYNEVKQRVWELLQLEPADSEEKYIGEGIIS